MCTWHVEDGRWIEITQPQYESGFRKHEAILEVSHSKGCAWNVGETELPSARKDFGAYNFQTEKSSVHAHEVKKPETP